MSEKRVALVIGNGNYPLGPLRNPVNDAVAVAAVLREAGFEVTQRSNLSHREMIEAIRAFGSALHEGGVALFYYSGHGMQLRDRNYLIPVDAQIDHEEDVESEGVDAARVLAAMAEARSRFNIVILDACRDNPFARSVRSASRGLAQITAPAGTLIAFSTAPGEVAADGAGHNGVYTEALVNVMRDPGLEIEQVFRKVRSEVRQTTNSRQIPWESSSVEGSFFLFPAEGTTSAAYPDSARHATSQTAALEEGLFRRSVGMFRAQSRLALVMWFVLAALAPLSLLVVSRRVSLARGRSSGALNTSPPVLQQLPSELTTAVDETGWALEKEGPNPVVYPIPAGRPLLVGRGEDSDIPLELSDRKASREHCRVYLERGVLMLEDLESRNGTRVNGEPVKQRHLRSGDRISCGGSTFRVFRSPAAATSEGWSPKL